MKLSDLTRADRYLLLNLKQNPENKYISFDRLRLNTLSAYGIVRYCGNLQFEFTEDGEDIMAEMNSEETSEDLPPGKILSDVEESSEPVSLDDVASLPTGLATDAV